MADVIALLPKNKRERLRVALDTYQGVDLIDIRLVAQLGQADAWSPTKRGVSVQIVQLMPLIAALQAAEAKARAAGQDTGCAP